MPAKKTPHHSARAKTSAGFSSEERSAMKARVKELKGETEGEAVVLARIAAMKEPDRSMAKRVHAIVMANAPTLTPRTWYGMPAYANADGKVVCFFKDAAKFKARYANLGFSDQAKLDDGNMWPDTYALKQLTPAEEARIAALVKKAVG